MGSLLFVVSGLFILLWVIGFKGYYPVEGNINALLIMALIALVLGIFERRSLLKRKMKEENPGI
jgi:putative effector of murein hydrolase